MMNFQTEPTGYEKTILSDLQEVWNVFRQAVVYNVGFEGWEKVLFDFMVLYFCYFLVATHPLHQR